MSFRSRLGAGVAACVALVALTAQAALAQPAAPGGGDQRYDTAPVVGGAGLVECVTSLRAWLNLHPDRRVRSLSPVLSQHGDPVAFVVGYVPDDNRGQTFDGFGTRAASPTDESVASYGSDLSAYGKANAAAKVIAFAGLPSQAGGIGGFVVLVEPR